MIYKYNYLCGASFEKYEGIVQLYSIHIYLISTVSLANQEDILPFRSL